MQKWEYCLLLYHVNHGVYLLRSSDGKQRRYPFKKHSWGGIMKWLGENGWEAVNYTSGIGDFGKIPMKGLGTDKIGWPIMHEILLKRPIEE